MIQAMGSGGSAAELTTASPNTPSKALATEPCKDREEKKGKEESKWKEDEVPYRNAGNVSLGWYYFGERLPDEVQVWCQGQSTHTRTEVFQQSSGNASLQ